MSPITPTISRRAAIGLGLGAAALVAVPRSARATPPDDAVRVNASDFRTAPDGSERDDTLTLQAALDHPGAEVVVIDDIGRDWSTRPLFLRRSDVTVLFAEGVTVRADTSGSGYSASSASVLTVERQQNVTIIGYRAQVIGTRPKYNAGEYRMGLKVRSVQNLLVEGLTLRDTEGDGIYLGVVATDQPNRDITVRNVVCDNNRRQGLSVVSVDQLLVEGSSFLRTNGTPPQAGIDFEPNNPGDLLTNIVLRDSVLSGNAAYQLVFALMHLDATSTPVSIVVERCLLDDPFYYPQLQVNGGLTTPVPGTIELRDLLIHTTDRVGVGATSGSISSYRKGVDDVHVTLANCVIWNWGNTFSVFRPITIGASRYNGANPQATYGGWTFTDCLLVTDQVPQFNAVGNMPVMVDGQPYSAPSQLTDVHGNLTVIGPSEVTAVLGPDPDVDLVMTAVPATSQQGALGAEVTVRFVEPTTTGGDLELEFTRQGGLMSAPLAVEYRLGGTAEERYDFAGGSSTAIFPANQDRVRVRLAVRPTGQPLPDSVTVELVERPFYRIRTIGRDRVLLRR